MFQLRSTLSTYSFFTIFCILLSSPSNLIILAKLGDRVWRLRSGFHHLWQLTEWHSTGGPKGSEFPEKWRDSVGIFDGNTLQYMGMGQNLRLMGPQILVYV